MKKLILNYGFDASLKKVTLTDYSGDFDIEGLLLIVNVTDNVIIYNFAVDGLGHTVVADHVVTLELASITSMDDADKLLIYYDDPVATQLVDLGTNNDVTVTSGAITVDGTVTANLGTTDNNVLDDVSDKLSDIKDAVEGTIDVGGAVTANAGTNLNTSALATSANQLADGHNVTVDNVGGVEVVQTTAADLRATVELGTIDNAMLDSIDARLDEIFQEAEGINSALDGDLSVLSGHGITGGGNLFKVVATAGTDVCIVGGSIPCKKLDIQAQTDNTGLIAVGFTGVDATIVDGTGIILNAGDIYSLEINNLNLIFIDSTVNGEGVRFTYWT